MSSFLSASPEQSKPKLLDQVRQLMRLRHYSLRTEEAYVGWIRRYILFHGKRHPRELDERHVSEFLSSLAINGRVAASTQNQALNALLFLYKEVLRRELGFVGNALRVKLPPKVPVVLSPDEVRAVLSHLDGQYRLMAQLLYGSGLRLLECLRLRVKDVDLHYLHITVRDPKGGRERKTMLPVSLAASLRQHLEKVKRQHEQDVAQGFGSVYLPGALERKMPSASREWAGNTCSPLNAAQSIHAPELNGGITQMKRTYKTPLRRRYTRQASASRRVATRCAIHLPRICSRTDTTFAPCRSC
jgi:integron integrase